MYTILLIDNSTRLETSLRTMLAEKRVDASIISVGDGKTAQKILMEGSRADVIFSDIDQPTSGGVELFTKLMPDFPHLRYVVVSDSQCFEMVKYVINLQLNGYLTKPIDPEETLSLLKQLIPDAFEKNENAETAGRAERDERAKRRLVNEVLSIIEREVEKDIGLDYIAQKVHISSCYLSALFREVTGQGMIAYITQYRMNLAVNLLLKSNLHIFEIAQQTGYRSTPYFCTVFKNKFGVTPSEYREAHLEPAAAEPAL